MKVHINPRYRFLEHFIKTVPYHKYTAEEVFCDHRNVVEKMTVNGVPMVIKKFKRPTLANMFIYRFFRHSKARRSFEYAYAFESLGFDTADPIAYIEERKGGLFHTGYYICRYLPYPSLAEIEEMDDLRKNEMLDQLAAYTHRLHTSGILHNDFNKANILYNKKRGVYSFALIDINRMTFKKPSRRKCMHDIKRLGFDFVTETMFIEKYTNLQRWNKEWFEVCIIMYRNFSSVPRKIKVKVKRMTRSWRSRKNNSEVDCVIRQRRDKSDVRFLTRAHLGGCALSYRRTL